MSELIQSGRIIDVILAMMVIEALVLTGYQRVTGRGIAALDLLPNLAAGAGLLLAFRLATQDAGWEWVAAALTAAFAAHAIDVGRRWRG